MQQWLHSIPILLLWCRAAEATAAEARRKYEAAKLAADEAEKARLAAEGLNQEAQARRHPCPLLYVPRSLVWSLLAESGQPGLTVVTRHADILI